jgi:hypothetical protein
MYARTKGWELGEVSVSVAYDNRATPRRFDVRIQLGGMLTDEQLRRLERVAGSCPIRRSIEAGIEFRETIVAERVGGTGLERVDPSYANVRSQGGPPCHARRLAMQKVVDSSPIIRSKNRWKWRVFYRASASDTSAGSRKSGSSQE